MNCIACFGGPLSPSLKISSSLENAIAFGSSANKTSVLCHSNSELVYPVLERPTDLCVSPEGLIYVVDFGSSCIRVY